MEKLNVGCGEFEAQGWTNIDASPASNANVLGSIFALPFADKTFQLIYLGHVLEHLDFESVPLALREVKRVLKDNGSVGVVGPDYEQAMLTHQSEHTVRGIIFGADRWGGDRHLWVSTCALTKHLLHQAFGTVKESNLGALKESFDFPVISLAPWQLAFIARG